MPLLCVVDDNEDICRLLAMALKRLGHEIRAFSSGRQLLEYLDEPRNPLPDLMILDYTLSGLTGLEILAGLRYRPRMALIPVVMFSAVEDSKVEAECLAAGACLYWVKSKISMAMIEATITALISNGPRLDHRRDYLSAGNDPIS